MRVIAGIHKGRALKSVPGKATRPTTDKVKEAVFQVMGPFFPGGNCLDLFAGSGSLGIEAISRGMEFAIFVDKDSKAINTIHENINLLKLTEQTEVYKTDAFRAIHAAAKRGLQFNLILVDPPYGKVNYANVINEVIKFDLLHENGIIYCEHVITETMPVLPKGLIIKKHENYGGTIGITIYEREVK